MKNLQPDGYRIAAVGRDYPVANVLETVTFNVNQTPSSELQTRINAKKSDHPQIRDRNFYNCPERFCITASGISKFA